MLLTDGDWNVEGYRLVRPIGITLTTGPDYKLVWDEYDITWGTGETADEALADLCQALASALFHLERDEARLSPMLQKELVLLREHIRPSQSEVHPCGS
jgi:hypothetical protein